MPFGLFQVSKESLKYFLLGLVVAAHCCHESDLTIFKCSSELARDIVSLLLLNFEIRTKYLSPTKVKGSNMRLEYPLQLVDDYDIRKFQSIMKSILVDKNDPILKKMPFDEKITKHERRLNDVIPGCSEFNNETKRIYDLIDKSKEKYENDIYWQTYHSHVHWDALEEIQTIYDREDEWVYDLTVEEDYTFLLANGLFMMDTLNTCMFIYFC